MDSHYAEEKFLNFFISRPIILPSVPSGTKGYVLFTSLLVYPVT